jgi:hypothetical protein
LLIILATPLEKQIARNLLFHRFAEINISEPTPDHSTLGALSTETRAVIADDQPA